LQFTNYR